MDVKLESLIEKIKKEGVEQAEQKANQIIKETEKKEKAIIEKAKKEAEKIKEEAKKEAENFKKSSQEAVGQAARDLVLSVKEKLIAISEALLKKEIEEALSSQVLANILEKAIEKWDFQKDQGLEVLLSQQDKEKVEKLLLARIKEKSRDKIEIKVSNSLKKGFQIGAKGEDVYYDFSDAGITEALSVFLNPFLSSLISNKKDG